MTITLAPSAPSDSLDGGWDLPLPYLALVQALPGDIDSFRHVNNAVYLTWCEQTAWSHSKALGLPMETCLKLDRGMIVIRSVAVYLRPVLLNEKLLIGTWLMPSTRKARVPRRFQMRRILDGETVARAEVEYTCIALSTGRPARCPAAFLTLYVALPEVEKASLSVSRL